MKKGFTLVEVIVVIGIVAILTVIIFPSVSNIRAKNRDTERVSDIAALQLALSLYYNKNGAYPESLDAAGLIPNYTPEESRIPPNSDSDYEYIYVPLTRDPTASPLKCTYYHLGTKLELPSGQIDPANNFSSLDSDDNDVPDSANGYKYCGAPVSGIPAFNDTSNEGNTYYSVRP